MLRRNSDSGDCRSLHVMDEGSDVAVAADAGTLCPMSRRQSPTSVDIRVAATPHVPARVVGYARDKIGTLFHLAPAPVLSARVRISRYGDPAVQHRVVAQANLDVNGRLVRAQATGDSAEEAIDRLQDQAGPRR
jgi:Sigma 54 modulation protein / S30EA ribosomal protein